MGASTLHALAASPDQIGLALTVKNEVSQVEPKVSKILQGDDIFRDEVVQTLADSGAKFVLKDSTNLVLGPSSKLKLDRAVFTDEKSIGDIAVKLSLGTFRFITGHSAKEAYAITTPIATMGVRGTTLDFLIEPAQNTVVLKDGRSQVCAGGKCVQLVNVGDTAIIKAYGAQINIEVQPSSSWSFDSACNGMCSPVSFAEAESSLTTGSIGAGVGGGGGTSGGGGATGSGIVTGGSNAGTAANAVPGSGNRSGSPLTVGFGSASFSLVSEH
ncbi:FecR domain-containing protein [Bradyrhizobium sp. MOS002]|uniref:FecR family protein n=1 Tax=Bradyrhizobium sp. MOS002 TaxID=2133947 RepID=UPI001FDFB21A|nr:FecR domain-containing protein [Bradyrhizobium sp. MOS002]